MYKKILVLGVCILAFNCYAQQFITENFNSYPLGEISTDNTGNSLGHGNWRVMVLNNGAPSNVVLVDDIQNKVSLEITSPGVEFFNTDESRIVWKDYLWNSRSSGNNVLTVSFDLYTGDDNVPTDSGATFRNVTRSQDNKIIAGFEYNPGTQVLYGLTYLEINGVVDLKYILMGNNGTTSLKLPKNKWVRITYQIDYNTDEVTFQIPSESVDGKIKTFSLMNRNPHTTLFFGIMSKGNTMPIALKFDNYNVSAQKQVLSNKKVKIAESVIFPNPSKNEIYVSNNLDIIELFVFDVLGKEVIKVNNLNKQEVNLDISMLSEGTYILKTKTKEGETTSKFIKK